jgi:pyrroloquinoline-quinone synthase
MTSISQPNSHDIASRLGRVTADHRLLDHPFYQAWAEGTLTLEDLAFYSKQYWRQVEAFPGYLESLDSRVPDGETKATLKANLKDEIEGDHPGLWLRFASAVGAPSKDVAGSVAEHETEECVSTFALATKEAPLPFALGMLYAYESQTPDVSKTKVAGLRDHYGIDGDDIHYFELHGEMDVEHSKGLASAIAEVTETEDDLKQAEAGAITGARAIWGLLDGVARVRDIG